MIAICDRHGPWFLGVRYDPKVMPRSQVRCPLCHGAVRAKRPFEHEPNVVTGERAPAPEATSR